jgi:hypothetical protein
MTAMPKLDTTTITLIGGPLNGETFIVRRGPRQLRLDARPRRKRGDHVPVAVYGRDTDEGDLTFIEIIGDG